MHVSVIFTPAGGRFGWGWVYFCKHCKIQLYEKNGFLVHDADEIKRTSMFKSERIPLKCPHAGQRYRKPKHEIPVEVKE